jgi:hypothetical protein
MEKGSKIMYRKSAFRNFCSSSIDRARKCVDIQLRQACHAMRVESRKDRVGGKRKRLHTPTISLRCLDNAKCSSILHAPTRVLEFRFAINFRARLLRKTFQVDLCPQGSDTMLPTEGERKTMSHERGVSHSTCEAVHGI